MNLYERYPTFVDLLATETLKVFCRPIAGLVTEYASPTEREYFYQMILAFPLEGVVVSTGNIFSGNMTLGIYIRPRPSSQSSRVTFVFKRGSSENSWSHNGHPRVIVTLLNIVDEYPVIEGIPECPHNLSRMGIKAMHDIFADMPIWPEALQQRHIRVPDLYVGPKCALI